MKVKLFQVAKALNISIYTIHAFLKKCGINIEDNPNTRVEDDVVNLLINEFSRDRDIKLKSYELSGMSSSKKQETTTGNSNQENLTFEPTRIIGPKVVGKIDIEISQIAKNELRTEDVESSSVASTDLVAQAVASNCSDETEIEKFSKIVQEEYESLPSLPGWYRNFEKLKNQVNLKLQESGKNITDEELKRRLERMGAKVNFNYINKNTGEQFAVVKLPSIVTPPVLSDEDRAKIIAHVRNIVDCKIIESDYDGWYDMASIALKLKSNGLTQNSYGYRKLLPLLEDALRSQMEIRREGPTVVYLRFKFADKNNNTSSVSSKSEANVESNNNPYSKEFTTPHHVVRNCYRRLLDEKSSENGWIKANELMTLINLEGNVTNFVQAYGLQFKAPNLVRFSNISRYEIVDDIYFDSKKNSYPKSIEKLKVDALRETWDENGKTNGLLHHYICYTYARIKEEGKISISKDGLCGCWNTGLVNDRFLPIYCYMTKKTPNERWMFQGFCIDGEDLGKEMVRKIADLPLRAYYFDSGDLLFKPEGNLAVDYSHIITEHPSRLPEEWVKRALGEKFIRQLENGNASLYDEQLGDLISHDREALSYLQTKVRESIDISLMRCQWNYKTAIPYYDPKSKSLGWFLPLCIGSKGGKLTPFAALVVTKEESGRYQGQTIYKLNWAYRCARLVCRPDSDWLSPTCEPDYDND